MLGKLKVSVFQVFQQVGMFQLVASSKWRRNRLAILCYHGVSLEDEHAWEPGLYLDGPHFRRRLEAIRKNGCAVVSLAEGLDRLSEGTLAPRSVAITFDDGFYDFRAIAWPLLREFGYPVTVYVPTYYAQNPWPVFDPALNYLLWKAMGQTLEWPEVIPNATRLDAQSRRKVLQALMDYVNRMGLSGSGKHEFLAEICTRLSIDYRTLCSQRKLCLMNMAELKELAEDGLDVQLHTHRHRMPTEDELFTKEIDDNRRALSMNGKLEHELEHFCYPSGVYYPQSGGLLKQCGVISATTCDHGLASRDSNLMYLPRYLDSANVPDVIFDAWLTGAYQMIPNRKHRYGAHP